MSQRYIQVIYCDDVRHEVNGKLSYIGVYSSRLFVPTFPAILPKLCVSVQVIAQAEEPLSSLTVRVLRDNEVLQQIVADDKQLSAASESSRDMTDDELQDRLYIFHFLLVFSPIQFDAPCVLKVRAQTESDELRGMGLIVAQAPANVSTNAAESGL